MKEGKGNNKSSDKTWICSGTMFIKSRTESAKSMIQQDQDTLDITINRMRDEIKSLTNKLMDLEGKPRPLSLTELTPLSRSEVSGLRNLLPTVSGAEYSS